MYLATGYRALFAAGLLALSACGSGSDRVSETANHDDHAGAEPVAQAPEQLPPDGAPLFDFLMREIPEVVSQVPCSCCPYTLNACYQGACPTTCGPCNAIGRAVYEWHQDGVSQADILARVAQKYPRR